MFQVSNPNVSLDFYEMFQSPWAISQEDEKQVEETIKLVGDILTQDMALSYLFWPLIWLSPPRHRNLPSFVEVGIRLYNTDY